MSLKDTRTVRYYSLTKSWMLTKPLTADHIKIIKGSINKYNKYRLN